MTAITPGINIILTRFIRLNKGIKKYVLEGIHELKDEAFNYYAIIILALNAMIFNIGYFKCQSGIDLIKNLNANSIYSTYNTPKYITKCWLKKIT